MILNGNIDAALCEKLEENAESWAKAARAFAGYSKALRGLAEVKDPDVSDAVDGIIESSKSFGWSEVGMSEDKAKAISGVGQKLIVALTKLYRKKELKAAVEGANPAIKEFAELWDAHLQVQLAQLDLASAAKKADRRRSRMARRAKRVVPLAVKLLRVQVHQRELLV